MFKNMTVFRGVMLNAGFPGIVLQFNRRLQIKQLWQDREAVSSPFTHRIINISIIGLSQFYSKKKTASRTVILKTAAYVIPLL